MSRPKFAFATVQTQKSLDACPPSLDEQQIVNLQQEIDELEQEIKCITHEITKLENHKIKMDYFAKRDAIDKDGNIFGLLQNINSYPDEDEFWQYENHPEFQNAMKLVAEDAKIPMYHKKPEDWSAESRYKIRDILNQEYAVYKLTQMEYVQKFNDGLKKLSVMKKDLQKDNNTLRTLKRSLEKLSEPTLKRKF